MPFRIAQFDYLLPPELIAQTPAQPRDSSRLLVLDRQTGEMSDCHFFDLVDFLGAGDVLVRNNTKVIPARIFGHKKDTRGSSEAVRHATLGGKCEILLLHLIRNDDKSCRWECLGKPGLKVNQMIAFDHSPLSARCVEVTGYTRILEFNLNLQSFYVELNRIGQTPIPPYIHWASDDEANLRQLYQTTYAKILGSAAAPTAGLHFTPELDEKLRERGVEFAEVTLHVGLGTFLPLQPEQLAAGKLHHEVYELSAATAAQLNAAKRAGKQIVAVGTTSTRVLETLATLDSNGLGEVQAGTGETDLFIQPGTCFKFVDKLITNFHLPKSSLLLLVAAFTSQPNAQHEFVDFSTSPVGIAYQHAIAEKYRFFSFGDGMLIQ